MKLYPDIQTAEQIWKEGYNYRVATSEFKNKEEYIFHTKGVAEAASQLAAKTPYLNTEKAYVLGLLHDYGKKYNEFTSGIFHAQAGYEYFLENNYLDVARVCLSHSFPCADFHDSDYTSYPPRWLNWAREKLKNYVYDDYDRLIQLCDLFFEGMSKVCFEKRFEGIARRYNLNAETQKLQKIWANKNKQYFDKLCGEDVYNILNIEDI